MLFILPVHLLLLSGGTSLLLDTLELLVGLLTAPVGFVGDRFLLLVGDAGGDGG